MNYFLIALALVITYCIGFLSGYGRQIRAKTFGWLHIDKKRNRFRFELNNALDLDKLPDNPKYVFLKVNPNADLVTRKESNDLNEM